VVDRLRSPIHPSLICEDLELCAERDTPTRDPDTRSAADSSSMALPPQQWVPLRVVYSPHFLYNVPQRGGIDTSYNTRRYSSSTSATHEGTLHQAGVGREHAGRGEQRQQQAHASGMQGVGSTSNSITPSPQHHQQPSVTSPPSSIPKLPLAGIKATPTSLTSTNPFTVTNSHSAAANGSKVWMTDNGSALLTAGATAGRDGLSVCEPAGLGDTASLTRGPPPSHTAAVQAAVTGLLAATTAAAATPSGATSPLRPGGQHQQPGSQQQQGCASHQHEGPQVHPQQQELQHQLAQQLQAPGVSPVLGSPLMSPRSPDGRPLAAGREGQGVSEGGEEAARERAEQQQQAMELGQAVVSMVQSTR
jgi:hypothetical protein